MVPSHYPLIPSHSKRAHGPHRSAARTEPGRRVRQGTGGYPHPARLPISLQLIDDGLGQNAAPHPQDDLLEEGPPPEDDGCRHQYTGVDRGHQQDVQHTEAVRALSERSLQLEDILDERAHKEEDGAACDGENQANNELVPPPSKRAGVLVAIVTWFFLRLGGRRRVLAKGEEQLWLCHCGCPPAAWHQSTWDGRSPNMHLANQEEAR
mmetsp:Transcript_71869/g.126617  ORF Transcript_71869/g.126617 Transcript_71869/m.126617 type:complete len:208 (+) Transcript_71869:40-663(+)